MERVLSMFLKDWTNHYRKRFHYAGQQLLITGRIFIMGKVSVGDSVMLEEGTRLVALENGTIKIGNHAYVAAASLLSTLSIELGNDVVISPRACIIDHDGYGLDGKPAVEKPVRIGNHVWIGLGASVLKGVSVGDNSVVGAFSVVARNVEPNTIVAGNPARKIRSTAGYTMVPAGPVYYPVPKFWRGQSEQ